MVNYPLYCVYKVHLCRHYLPIWLTDNLFNFFNNCAADIPQGLHRIEGETRFDFIIYLGLILLSIVRFVFTPE